VARACRCDYFSDPKELVGLVSAVSVVVPTKQSDPSSVIRCWVGFGGGDAFVDRRKRW
jgi:hypothetical protein